MSNYYGGTRRLAADGTIAAGVGAIAAPDYKRRGGITPPDEKAFSEKFTNTLTHASAFTLDNSSRNRILDDRKVFLDFKNEQNFMEDQVDYVLDPTTRDEKKNLYDQVQMYDKYLVSTDPNCILTVDSMYYLRDARVITELGDTRFVVTAPSLTVHPSGGVEYAFRPGDVYILHDIDPKNNTRVWRNQTYDIRRRERQEAGDKLLLYRKTIKT